MCRLRALERRQETGHEYVNLIRAGLGGCNMHNSNLMDQLKNMEADIVCALLN